MRSAGRTPGATRRPPGSTPTRVTAPTPPPPSPKWPRVAAIGAAAVLALAALLAAGFALARGGKPEPEVTRPTAPTPEVGPAVTKPLVTTPAALPPVAARLPAGATGVLVVQARAYWARVAYEKSPDTRLTGNVVELARGLGLDIRHCRRGLLVFRGPATAVVAEGAGRSDTLTGPLPTPVAGLTAAASLGNDAHAFAAADDFLRDLAARPAGPGAPDLAKALDAAEAGAGAADEPPLLLFAATGGYVLPEGDTLANQGVRQLAVSVRVAGDDLVIRLTVQGKSKAALDDFLSIYLATRMLEQRPHLKPLTDLLGTDDTRETSANGVTEMTVTARLSWATAHETLDKLLPPAEVISPGSR